MFDHVAVHVGDPQSAVRAGGDENRSKPVVARRQKIAILFIHRAATAKGRAVPAHHGSRDQIVDGFARKRVARKSRIKQVASINNRAAGRRKPVGRVKIVEAFQRAADWKHGRISGNFRNLAARIGRRHVRIAAEVPIVEREVKHGAAVVAANQLPQSSRWRPN